MSKKRAFSQEKRPAAHKPADPERAAPQPVDPASQEGVPADRLADRPADRLGGVAGPSVEVQAARLRDPGWQGAQRRALAEQIGHAQGNMHVQRLVDAAQVLRKEQEVFGKDALRDVLRAILGLEWMSQSNGKGPIQLTPRLASAIQAATSLSSEDLGLLWRQAPKTPGEALRNLDHALPATVPASVMKRLQDVKLGLIVSGGAAKSAQSGGKALTGASAAQKGPEALAGIKEKEALLKAIAGALEGKTPEDKSQGTEAVKKTLEAFFETESGKKVKERVLGLLLSKKGLPFTILVGSGALAAMIASNTDIPSTPEIPLADNLSIKVEFEGTFQEPKGVKFVLKFAFGGPSKEAGEKKKPATLALPADVRAAIGQIDRQALIRWIAQRAYYEYEMAGPDEEEEKRQFYMLTRDRPGSLGLPDAQLVAEALARTLIEGAIQNRINQLQGKEVQKRIQFDLGHAGTWDRFYALQGLPARLDQLLNLLVPKVPYKALGIEQVTFVCGKRLVPIRVKR